MLFTDRRHDFAVPCLSSAVAIAAVNSAGIRDVTDATLRWLEGSVNRLMRFTGDVRVDEVTPQVVYEWHLGIAAVASPVTANSYLRAVATVFSRLVAAGVLAMNPARGVPLAKEPPRSPKAVSRETYGAMRAAAAGDGTGPLRDRAIVDVLWATGCRLGGLLSMTTGGLEFWRRGEELRLAAVVMEKFGKGRYVYARSPQADSIRDWLEIRPPGSDAVFVNVGDRSQGRPMTDIGVQHVLRRLRLAAGLREGTAANAHGFRHAYAIRMLDEGHDLAAVAAWLGHSDPAFTAKVYVNRREDELRRKWFGDD